MYCMYIHTYCTVCVYACMYVLYESMYIHMIIYTAAYCSQGCYNSGKCTSPSICTCNTGWTGADCKIGLLIYSVAM